MEVVQDVIVVPLELLNQLPRRPRNAVEVLMRHPNGILSDEFAALLGLKTVSASCRSKKHLLAQYGFEIVYKKCVKGDLSLWRLKKIEPKVEKPTEEPETKFKIGKDVWYLACPITNGLIAADIIFVSKTSLLNVEDLNFANLITCYNSAEEAHAVKESMPIRIAINGGR